jgi:hypothetical protein
MIHPMDPPTHHVAEPRRPGAGHRIPLTNRVPQTPSTQVTCRHEGDVQRARIHRTSRNRVDIGRNLLPEIPRAQKSPHINRALYFGRLVSLPSAISACLTTSGTPFGS